MSVCVRTARRSDARIRPLATLLLVLALGAAACGPGAEDEPEVVEGEPSPDPVEETAEAPEEDPEPTPEETAPEEPSAPEPLRVQFDWLANPGYAPVLLAYERGYFEEAGLDVTLSEGGPTVPATQMLATDQADMVVGTLDGVPQGRAEGMPLVAVAVMERQTTAGIIVREDGDINEPDDLVGARIASVPGGAAGVLLEPYLATIGIDPDSTTINNVDPSTFGALLARGEVDAVAAFIRDWATRIEVALDIPVRVFPYADAGLGLLSTGIYTREDVLAERPDVVRTAVSVMLRGYQEAIEEPEAAVEAAAIHFPQHYDDMEAAAAHMSVFAEGLQAGIPPEGMGYMQAEEWELTIDILGSYFGLDEVLPVSEYYTNDYLPGG